MTGKQFCGILLLLAATCACFALLMVNNAGLPF